MRIVAIISLRFTLIDYLFSFGSKNCRTLQLRWFGYFRIFSAAPHTLLGQACRDHWTCRAGHFHSIARFLHFISRLFTHSIAFASWSVHSSVQIQIEKAQFLFIRLIPLPIPVVHFGISPYLSKSIVVHSRSRYQLYVHSTALGVPNCRLSFSWSSFSLTFHSHRYHSLSFAMHFLLVLLLARPFFISRAFIFRFLLSLCTRSSSPRTLALIECMKNDRLRTYPLSMLPLVSISFSFRSVQPTRSSFLPFCFSLCWKSNPFDSHHFHVHYFIFKHPLTFLFFPLFSWFHHLSLRRSIGQRLLCRPFIGSTPPWPLTRTDCSSQTLATSFVFHTQKLPTHSATCFRSSSRLVHLLVRCVRHCMQRHFTHSLLSNNLFVIFPHFRFHFIHFR